MLLGSLAFKPQLRLVYNASDSAPRGWYLVSRAIDLRVGDYVVASLPEPMAALASSRGYLPSSIPVLKRIAADEGDRVCTRDGRVSINGMAVARTLDEDGQHRPMHVWAQCRQLVRGELFLLNPGNPASFDSRYFGPIDVSFVRGRATAW